MAHSINAHRYLQLDPALVTEGTLTAAEGTVAAFDAGVARGVEYYLTTQHYRILSTNCHEMVAHCLNLQVRPGGRCPAL